MQTPEERKAYMHEYNQRPERKAANLRRERSEKYKVKRAEYMKTEGRKAAVRRYNNSAKKKETYLKRWNSPEEKARMAAYNRSPVGRYKIYADSAKLRNLSFELTFDQFMVFWQKPCSYCGGEIATIGLDRTDNAVGYTIANVVPCCWTCNKAKLKRSKSEYIAHCRQIIKHCDDHKEAI